MRNAAVPVPLAPVDGLRMVVLDWAGTTVDFGSVAPIKTLLEVFAQAGISLTEEEARRDMGLPKKEHIRNILAAKKLPESDVEGIYRAFIPLQLACLERYSEMIAGVAEAVNRFRKRGLKIGTTTGYTREMLERLVKKSAGAGYLPDCNLTPEDVGAGRPAPFMMWTIAVRLGVYPMAAIVKVGDTPADVAEGLNAGAWSVGVAKTGNMVGITADEFDALPAGEQHARLGRARDELTAAGAHYVVDSVAELDPVLDDIDARLRSSAR